RTAARLGGVASMDNYPDGPSDPIVTAYLLDLTRGAAGPGGQAWIMEQQPGPINWTEMNPPVPPGQVRVWMWQAALHGFDAQLFFRWRAARHGQEMYHSGLLRQDSSETVAVDEIRETIRHIIEHDLPKPEPRVALLHDFADSWAIEINPHRQGMTHRSLQIGAYGAARRLGLDVAIVDPTGDLTEFDVILAPALHITTPERISALSRASDAGRLVVVGPRSLVVDEHYAWSDSPLPGGLATRLGARVTEHLSQPGSLLVDPWGTEAGVWTDILEADDAEVLARYRGDSYLDGSPAVVQRDSLVYAGFSGEASWLALLADLLDLVVQPAGVEVFVRQDQTFTIDHTRFAVESGPTSHPVT
ncbi:MAG: beta-galactosidase trimerization domain-containing protein, partial [Acidimicrobiia bacterium]|nr:beta-galactosidase trimerization domain-containing protein [Acidimicrobiia bacterium]